MKKISFGIILLGDPDYKQKKNIWISMLSWISNHGWIICSILMIIALILFIVKPDGERLFTFIKFGLFTGVLLICSTLWSERFRCPFCGHFTRMTKISGNVYLGSSSQSISRTEYDSHSGAIYDFHGNSAFYSGLSSRKVHGEEVTDNYACNVRCNVCGCVHKIKLSKTYKQF